MSTLLSVIRFILWIGCLLIASNVARAEDEDLAAPVQIENGGFDVDPSNFDQWVFGGNRSAAQGKQHLENQLQLHLEEVHRVCEISDAQKKKLQLAGRGDQKRFHDDVEVVRKEFLLVRRDQEKFNQLWQKISPLQLRLATGLYGAGSFFLKTVQQTLTAEQFVSYEKAQFERRKARYFARVEQFIVLLESGLPLKDEQRQALIKLFQDEKDVPPHTGQYDVYVIQYRLAMMPEDKLLGLFDAQQWKVLKRQREQGKQMKQFLRLQKILPDTDD